MKLATLKSSSRDGILAVVSRDLKRIRRVPEITPNLQHALESWPAIAPLLEPIYLQLNTGSISSQPLDFDQLAAPLPRAYQWLDGSAYLSHVERVRRARGAEMPPSFLHDPLMYQGGSDGFLGPRYPIYLTDETWDLDFEAEVAIITDDVPLGISQQQAAEHIQLLMLVNDISLRSLIPAELAKGFGFLQGKPACAFSPVAVTPDELGVFWQDNKVHLPLITLWNGERFGHPDAGNDMQFDFARLINHAARTRPLAAGTIIGSGTVSNLDLATGCSCIVERRVIESMETGAAATRFLRPGDRVRIEMRDDKGCSVFGAIDQEVRVCPV